jgi:hypothetical protein
MSTQIITKTKTSLVVIKPSELAIVFDYMMPEGTTARAEYSPDAGFLQLNLLSITTDPEVQGEVYVLVNGTEEKLVSLDEDSHRDVDVIATYGVLAAKKLILVGKVKTTTTDVRQVSLKYSGQVFDYR